MNLFDPARGERRMLFWNEKPVGYVPSIQFTPLEPLEGEVYPTLFLAEVCIMIAPSTGRWLECKTSTPLELLQDYTDSPEDTLRVHFNWEYMSRAKPVNSRGLTLADLGEL